MMRIVTLLATLAISVGVSAQEISFNSIGRGAEASRVGEWLARDVWAPDRITDVSNPEYPGVRSVRRFVVQPGDKVGGWTGERAEFSGIRTTSGVLRETERSGTQYFAFSVLIPAGWKMPEVDPASKVVWGTFLQLHGPLGFPNAPPISIDLTDKYTVSVRGGDSDALGDWHGKTYQLTDGGKIRPDLWEDFVLMVKFARNDDGEVRLWRRTDGVLTQVFEQLRVPTLVYKPSVEAKAPEGQRRMLAGAHYWKQGYYRSTSPNVTTTLYQTGLVRASSFEAATLAAFGKREIRPATQ